MGDERQGTHWQGCWRAHHACAVSLLDKILREDTIGEEEARRLLADARAKAEQFDGDVATSSGSTSSKLGVGEGDADGD